jgi:phage terminase Nu1 subunit (DNA packaging protein)
MSAEAKSPTVDVGTLAKLFSLTEVRIQQLAKDKVIAKTGRGRYELWPSIKGYIKFLQERRVNQWDGKDEDLSELKREQLRRTKEEADKLELANARTRGELVEIAAVKPLGANVLIAVRNRILSFPLTDDEKDQCLRELLALADMDWTREAR